MSANWRRKARADGRKVRRAVDGKAFGFNYFILPPNQEGREYAEGTAMLELRRVGYSW